YPRRGPSDAKVSMTVPSGLKALGLPSINEVYDHRYGYSPFARTACQAVKSPVSVSPLPWSMARDDVATLVVLRASLMRVGPTPTLSFFPPPHPSLSEQGSEEALKEGRRQCLFPPLLAFSMFRGVWRGLVTV
ncbi:hypothetical protein BHM03_00043554, partial [Ensete ventricosum]